MLRIERQTRVGSDAQNSPKAEGFLEKEIFISGPKVEYGPSEESDRTRRESKTKISTNIDRNWRLEIEVVKMRLEKQTGVKADEGQEFYPQNNK